MSREFELFLKTNLSRYKGLYIAILGDEIVASGKNAKQVWEKCRKKYPNKIPTIAKIPREETLILVIKCK
ncbi:MAG: DUF5678 domain-containing protein [Euryarchaeota archaeon]|nr:DUF5678 domain-containing protein [Euryarchaeota archaeon]